MDDQFYYVKEAARILKTHEQTVRILERKGILPAFRDFNGWRVFKKSDVLALKAARSRLRPAENHD